MIEIAPPPVLDSAGAVELRRLILDVGADGADIVLNGRDISRVGTAGVQILLAAAAQFQSDGHRWAVLNPSVALRDAFSELGLEAEFNNWSIH